MQNKHRFPSPRFLFSMLQCVSTTTKHPCIMRAPVLTTLCDGCKLSNCITTIRSPRHVPYPILWHDVSRINLYYSNTMYQTGKGACKIYEHNTIDHLFKLEKPWPAVRPHLASPPKHGKIFFLQVFLFLSCNLSAVQMVSSGGLILMMILLVTACWWSSSSTVVVDTRNVKCPTIVRTSFLPTQMGWSGECLRFALVRPGRVENPRAPRFTFIHYARVFKLFHQSLLASRAVHLLDDSTVSR